MDKIKRRFLHGNTTNYGLLGEVVPNAKTKIRDQIHVGDIVLWKTEEGKVGTAVVAKKESGEPSYFVMGWGSHSLPHDERVFEIDSIVVSFKDITTNILKQSHSSFAIEEEEVPLLSMEDIKKLIPFEFELKN